MSTIAEFSQFMPFSGYDREMDRRIFDRQGRFVVPRVRRRRFEIEQESRFLTFSCFNRLALFQNDRIKDHFVDVLRDAADGPAFRLIAWVVMPEHVHLLLMPHLPEHPVAGILQSLKQTHARRIVGRWRDLQAPVLDRITDSRGEVRFWQRGGGYDRNIRTKAELFEKISYIHKNPMKRGLVTIPIDWQWSSARAYRELDEAGPRITRIS